jgi:hypothetical protein
MNFRLTGQFRHRLHSSVFGKMMLVLIVEEAYDDGPPDGHGLPEYLSGKRWRDATVEDLAFQFSPHQRSNS